MISLIHPSRGRPVKAEEALQNWWGDYMRGHDFEHILSIDEDDPNKGQYLELFPIGYTVIVNNNKSLVEATNRAAEKAVGDIIVYLSDDFRCPENWIQLLITEFDKYPGQPIVLKVDDCLQKFHVAVLTIPIMNRLAYEALGYFFNPDFKSMHVDEHLYWRSKKLGFLRFAPHLKFPHDHYSIGLAKYDETYKRSEANWDHGKNALAIHKKEGFIR